MGALNLQVMDYDRNRSDNSLHGFRLRTSKHEHVDSMLAQGAGLRKLCLLGR